MGDIIIHVKNLKENSSNEEQSKKKEKKETNDFEKKSLKVWEDSKEPIDKEREIYKKRNGLHFNQPLSDWAISKLINSDGSSSHISIEKCKDMLKQSDKELPEGSTIGDLHYVVNKKRAEHLGSAVKTEPHCLILALDCLDDPNKEEGEIFCDWTEHMCRKNENIPWSKFN